MVGNKGLNHGPACLFSPACPAHHLGQQREGPLPRPEIVHKQGLVGQDYPHQGDIFKIQPLGHHLGTDEDGRLSLPELVQDVLVGVGGGDGVRVHTQNVRAGQQLLQLLLHLLGPHADEVQHPAALRTAVRQGLGKAAVVAHEPVVGRVVGEVDRAPGALGHKAALPAGDHAVGPPSVEKQDGLLSPAQGLLQGSPQRRADGASVAPAQLLLQVHHLHLRQGLLIIPAG